MITKIILTILAMLTMGPMMGAMSAFGQTVNIPPELSSLADQALSVACKYNEVGKFDAIMDEIGKKVDAKTFNTLLPQESQLLQAKVIVVAYYRAQHGELYDKVMDKFVNVTENSPDLMMHGGPRSPEVTSEYLNEEYRLIWEYYVLSMGRMGMKQVPRHPVRTGFAWRSIEALGKIGSEKSLLVLELSYKKVLEQGFELGTLATIKQAIFDIGSSKSNDAKCAFRVYLNCYVITEKYDSEFVKAEFYDKNAEAFFLKQFNGAYKEVLEKWQAAARGYPKDGLTQREISFIQTILDRK